MTSTLLTIQDEISKGNEKAFTELYSRFHRSLYLFAMAITRSSELSEEAVEDVFLKLWNSRTHIQSIENLPVYLYVAVKNRALNAVKKRPGLVIEYPSNDAGAVPASTSADPYNLLVADEMMRSMQKAVDALPRRCKMIFRLVREDGLRYKEVAEILNISVNTIDVQMAIAVKRISAIMQSTAHTGTQRK
jgi:RNA polymerase sigma-70 factor (family 1)